MSCPAKIVKLFDIKINNLSKKEAVETCFDILDTSSYDSHCQYIVTPNVDHVLMLKHNGAFQKAYNDARLVIADGNPIVWDIKT